MTISHQDKKALIVCVGFLMAFIGIQFVLLPAIDKKKELSQRVTSKEASLKELVTLENEYIKLSGSSRVKITALSGRDKDFTLFSFLDTLAEKSGVKDNVAYIKPSSRTLNDKAYAISMVKIKLDALYLKELVEFIHGVEISRNNVQIKSISLSKTGKDNALLDAIVEAETLIKGDAA